MGEVEDTNRLAPPQMVQGDPRTLTLLDINARFLPHEQFRQPSRTSSATAA
ncbi:hypothetical protein [Streptomyces sp. NPDC002276]